MTEAEMLQRVHDEAKNALAAIPLKNLQVRTRLRSFLDGSLFFVYYQPSHDTKELLLYAAMM